ncbi:MAG: hypothetical protein HFJ48_04250 [Clostridia bacterium]|nr:hypothetical protein [Clostridia bacterium]
MATVDDIMKEMEQMRQIINRQEENIRRLEKKIERLEKISLCEENKIKRELLIKKYLHDIGIPTNYSGYVYLQTAIQMAIEDPKNASNVSKEIYTAIAIKYYTDKGDAQKVKNVIDRAIEKAWKTGNKGFQNNIFVLTNKAKPTNKQFIIGSAEYIKKYMQKEK